MRKVRLDNPLVAFDGDYTEAHRRGIDQARSHQARVQEALDANVSLVVYNIKWDGSKLAKRDLLTLLAVSYPEIKRTSERLY